MRYVLIIMIFIIAGCAQEKADTGPEVVAKKETSVKGTKKETVQTEKKEPATPLKCEVVTVATDNDTKEVKSVMLNVGRDKNVKRGNEFYIYRGKTYVCSVVVQKVFDTSVVCSIIAESVNKDKKGNRLEPQKGDQASNKIFE